MCSNYEKAAYSYFSAVDVGRWCRDSIKRKKKLRYDEAEKLATDMASEVFEKETKNNIINYIKYKILRFKKPQFDEILKYAKLQPFYKEVKYHRYEYQIKRLEKLRDLSIQAVKQTGWVNVPDSLLKDIGEIK